MRRVALWLLAIAGCGDSHATTDAVIDSFVVDGAPNSPAIHYTFDDDDNNTGWQPNQPATLAGATFVPGKFGHALHFDALQEPGPGTFATIPNATAILGPSSSTYTISFWFRNNASGATDANAFLFFNNVFTLQSGIGVAYEDDETMTTAIGSAYEEVPAPSLGVWHSMVITYDSSGLGFFVDSVLAQNLAYGSPVFNLAEAPELTLGGGYDLDIDEFQIFDQVFDDAQRCTIVVTGTYDPVSGSGCTLP